MCATNFCCDPDRGEYMCGTMCCRSDELCSDTERCCSADRICPVPSNPALTFCCDPVSDACARDCGLKAMLCVRSVCTPLNHCAIAGHRVPRSRVLPGRACVQRRLLSGGPTMHERPIAHVLPRQSGLRFLANCMLPVAVQCIGQL